MFDQQKLGQKRRNLHVFDLRDFNCSPFQKPREIDIQILAKQNNKFAYTQNLK
jgi:hypothetical protein